MSNFRTILTGWGLVFFLVILVPSRSYAQDGDEDRDIYKLSIAGDWWFSHPSGYFNGKDKEGYFDINRDFGFSNYSTFTGAVDWRFKRKHHLLFAATPLISSRTATLTRTIEFQGQTFDVG